MGAAWLAVAPAALVAPPVFAASGVIIVSSSFQILTSNVAPDSLG
jgi:hypothetical protein